MGYEEEGEANEVDGKKEDGEKGRKVEDEQVKEPATEGENERVWKSKKRNDAQEKRARATWRRNGQREEKVWKKEGGETRAKVRRR
ncbi:hypothetical protein ElyMa_003274900 [Elysia marginata]|uniref:Uncharacterized protein n=1 Tax=Elysia marginata TaxID=1093978 RepID=A0AAV4J7Z2_9GAST|nr:hypothetical protein ElyMa_003274900 [Elysia marginata]